MFCLHCAASVVEVYRGLLYLGKFVQASQCHVFRTSHVHIPPTYFMLRGEQQRNGQNFSNSLLVPFRFGESSPNPCQGPGKVCLSASPMLQVLLYGFSVRSKLTMSRVILLVLNLWCHTDGDRGGASGLPANSSLFQSCLQTVIQLCHLTLKALWVLMSFILFFPFLQVFDTHTQFCGPLQSAWQFKTFGTHPADI